MAKTDNRSAHAIITRAVHLFDDYADAGMLIAPGTHVRFHQGVTVVLAMHDEMTGTLGILSGHGDKLFTCEVIADGAATVTAWQAGDWERAFVRADA